MLAHWQVTDESTSVNDSVALELKPGSRRLRIVVWDNRLVSPKLTWNDLLGLLGRCVDLAQPLARCHSAGAASGAIVLSRQTCGLT